MSHLSDVGVILYSLCRIRFTVGSPMTRLTHDSEIVAESLSYRRPLAEAIPERMQLSGGPGASC